MKKLLIVPMLALCLAGCGTVTAAAAGAAGLPPTPQAAADATVLDEQAAIDLELAYKALRLAVETGVDAGLIKGARATQAAALDNKAFAALRVARSAYRAGNATGYLAALAEARSAINDALALAH
jgi:uncharacterized protein YceK